MHGFASPFARAFARAFQLFHSSVVELQLGSDGEPRRAFRSSSFLHVAAVRQAYIRACTVDMWTTRPVLQLNATLHPSGQGHSAAISLAVLWQSLSCDALSSLPKCSCDIRRVSALSTAATDDAHPEALPSLKDLIIRVAAHAVAVVRAMLVHGPIVQAQNAPAWEGQPASAVLTVYNCAPRQRRALTTRERGRTAAIVPV